MGRPGRKAIRRPAVHFSPRIIVILALAAIVLSPIQGRAGFLTELGPNEGRDFHPADLDEPGIYVGPNEPDPRLQIPLLADAPSGVQMAVGTERGWIGYALNPRATHLLLVDRDVGVRTFNQINLALLQVSRSREDYLELRLKAGPEVWRQRIQGSSLEKELLPLFKDNDLAWEWWQEYVRKGVAFQSLHSPPRGAAWPFAQANYLYDDALWRRVHEVATDHRVEALAVDFKAPQKLAKVSQSLERRGLKISVFDLSNAWWDVYTGPEVLGTTLETLGHNTQKGSLIVLTHKPLGVQSETAWLYSASRYDRIVAVGRAREFGESLGGLRSTPGAEVSMANRVDGYIPVLRVRTCLAKKLPIIDI